MEQAQFSSLAMPAFIPLLHEAADEGRIAGENAARLALGMPVIPGLRRTPINIVFTDPQIAIVGGGFHSLKPDTFEIGQASFEDQGRSRVLLKNKGLLNVYGDIATGRFLGAEMLAPAAEHGSSGFEGVQITFKNNVLCYGLKMHSCLNGRY